MISEDVSVPTAFCEGDCYQYVPVWISEVDISGEVIPVVVCAGCETVLSSDKDIEVKYYKLSEVEEAIGWRVVDAPEL